MAVGVRAILDVSLFLSKGLNSLTILRYCDAKAFSKYIATNIKYIQCCHNTETSNFDLIPLKILIFSTMFDTISCLLFCLYLMVSVGQ